VVLNPFAPNQYFLRRPDGTVAFDIGAGDEDRIEEMFTGPYQAKDPAASVSTLPYIKSPALADVQ